MWQREGEQRRWQTPITSQMNASSLRPAAKNRLSHMGRPNRPSAVVFSLSHFLSFSFLTTFVSRLRSILPVSLTSSVDTSRVFSDPRCAIPLPSRSLYTVYPPARSQSPPGLLIIRSAGFRAHRAGIIFGLFCIPLDLPSPEQFHRPSIWAWAGKRKHVRSLPVDPLLDCFSITSFHHTRLL